MWQRQVLVLGICGLITMEVARCSASRFNGATSAGNQNPQLKLEMNAWQPFTQHNNWLILQATAPSSMQPERAEIRERRKEPERLPVNFYAYNHRYNESSPTPGGNYKPNPPNDPSSYVLAISQQMRRGQLLRQLPKAEDVEPEVHKVAATLTHPVNGDDDNNQDDENRILPGGPGDGEQASLRGVESYLAPFERALVKVRDFCDALRSVISEEADETGSNKLDATAGEGAVAVQPPGSTSKELLVQGRFQRLASALSEGRKLKKLKKKIQKLFFPLLIAYKLKFLTLIPVLIGGLTLLVGTTGLAGFFFALFTAVMSLKSSGGGGHASKSLVLKKL
ncbi:uncharacterized protein LOC117144077 isoform X1 [Drosophila mauritiana]|uniref:Uncharacterized protein LOC117144077 isoform X1 n=1 Tax=Drosophila mauritiana TaxID=7226 RepID=A0A6P8KLK3_DROMA|nr:uncharacterized protein LOC117144077 isoform X1 [Drosophila mauritiana]XP_033164979.1 uncharacterized protein LOC117144077 isoform X1 [Drosophila mauritiana]